MRGLEPPRCHHHRLLRPARLPVPPHPRAVRIYEPDHGVSRHDSLQLSQCNSDTKVAAAVPVAIPGFVITISRVRPGIGVLISEVRLRIPVRVIPISVVRLRCAVRIVLAAVNALGIAVRIGPITVIRPALVNHIRPRPIVIDNHPAAMRSSRASSLTESSCREDCAQDKSTNRSMKQFRENS
jgi:hypothetical protein